MTLTLLFDLDDTLLSNDIDAFLPGYLKALGRHLKDYVAPDVMIHRLLAATQEMITNNNARFTLEQAFDQSFYPAIGHSKEELRSTLEYFYDQVYPSLEGLTRPRPAARELVARTAQQGHTLVVATNPLFPRKAILHRVHWAGLPPENVSFALITSYEGMHFSKPNPAYLAEILAQLGWPQQPAVMVGNSLTEDLLPAACLGLPVFWVNNGSQPLPAGLHPLSASGALSDVAEWVDRVNLAQPAIEITRPAGLLAVLKATPAALDSLVSDVMPDRWSQRPAAEQWSLTEIVCHLRDVDQEVNLPRIQKVLAENNPFVAGIDSDTWAIERGYNQHNGPQELRNFIQARTSLVSYLENIAEDAWDRPARHAIFGPTTLKEMVSFIITHDQSHIQQVITTRA